MHWCPSTFSLGMTGITIDVRRLGALPPAVSGRRSGYLILTVDEVLWCRRPPGEVTVLVKWWGQVEDISFKPLDVKSISSGKSCDTEYYFEILTNMKMFECYLKDCESLDFTVIDEQVKNTIIGTVTVSNLPHIVHEKLYQSYFPIINSFGNRIGDLHICFTLKDIPYAYQLPLGSKSSFEDETETGLQKSSEINITDTKGKAVGRSLCSIKHKSRHCVKHGSPKLKGSSEQSIVSSCHTLSKEASSVPDVLISQILERGQRLRNAMVKSMLDDGMNIVNVNDSGAVGQAEVNCKKSFEVPSIVSKPESLVVEYLLGKNMKDDDEEMVMETLGKMSPPTILTEIAKEIGRDGSGSTLEHVISTGRVKIPLSRKSSSTSSESDGDISIQKEPQKNKKQVRLLQKGDESLKPTSGNKKKSADEREISFRVKYLRVTMHHLILNMTGMQRVLVSSWKSVRPSGQVAFGLAPPGVTYFIEYEVPHPLTSLENDSVQNPRIRPWVSKLKRFCSKKQVGQTVYFGQESVHVLASSKPAFQEILDCSCLIFKIYSRYLNQRIPAYLGESTFPLCGLLESEHLEKLEHLSITSKGHSVRETVQLGLLKVTVELGSSRTCFGSSVFSQNAHDSNRFVESEIEGTCKDPTISSNVSPREVKPEKLSHHKEPCFKSTKAVKQTETSISNIVEPNSSDGAVLLHGLLHIIEGRGFQPLSTYLVCRAFWKDDVMISDVCWDTDNPYYDFSELMPVLLTNDLLRRCHSNFLVTEVWAQDSQDFLVGIAKFPLNQFYIAYRNTMVTAQLLKSKFPVVSVDGWVNVIDPSHCRPVGQLYVILALGTENQVQLLEISRGLKCNASAHAPLHTLPKNTEGVSSVLIENEICPDKRHLERPAEPLPFDHMADTIWPEYSSSCNRIVNSVASRNSKKIKIQTRGKRQTIENPKTPDVTKELSNTQNGQERCTFMDSREESLKMREIVTNIHPLHPASPSSQVSSRPFVQQSWQEEFYGDVPPISEGMVKFTKHPGYSQRVNKDPVVVVDQTVINDKKKLGASHIFETNRSWAPTVLAEKDEMSSKIHKPMDIARNMHQFSDNIKCSISKEPRTASCAGFSETLYTGIEMNKPGKNDATTSVGQKYPELQTLPSTLAKENVTRKSQKVMESKAATYKYNLETNNFLTLVQELNTTEIPTGTKNTSKAYSCSSKPSQTDVETHEEQTNNSSYTTPDQIQGERPSNVQVISNTNINKTVAEGETQKETTQILDFQQRNSCTDVYKLGTKEDAMTQTEQWKDTYFRARIEVVNAVNLPMADEGIHPSYYVTFHPGFSNKIIATPVVADSNSPCWHWSCETWFSSQLLQNGAKRLILKVWYKLNGSSQYPDAVQDAVIGFAAVDLSVLLIGMPWVSGWFNITNFTGHCKGQIKASVTPLENLSRFVDQGKKQKISQEYLHTESFGKEVSAHHPDLERPPLESAAQSNKTTDKDQGQESYAKNSLLVHHENNLIPARIGCNETEPNLENPEEAAVSSSFLSQALKQKLSELDEITQRLKRRLELVTKEDDIMTMCNPWLEEETHVSSPPLSYIVKSDNSAINNSNSVAGRKGISSESEHWSMSLCPDTSEKEVMYKIKCDKHHNLLQTDKAASHSRYMQRTDTQSQKSKYQEVIVDKMSHPNSVQQRVEQCAKDFDDVTDHIMQQAVNEIELENIFNPLLFQHLVRPFGNIQHYRTSSKQCSDREQSCAVSSVDKLVSERISKQNVCVSDTCTHIPANSPPHSRNDVATSDSDAEANYVSLAKPQRHKVCKENVQDSTSYSRALSKKLSESENIISTKASSDNKFIHSDKSTHLSKPHLEEFTGIVSPHQKDTHDDDFLGMEGRNRISSEVFNYNKNSQFKPREEKVTHDSGGFAVLYPNPQQSVTDVCRNYDLVRSTPSGISTGGSDLMVVEDILRNQQATGSDKVIEKHSSSQSSESEVAAKNLIEATCEGNCSSGLDNEPSSSTSESSVFEIRRQAPDGGNPIEEITKYLRKPNLFSSHTQPSQQTVLQQDAEKLDDASSTHQPSNSVLDRAEIQRIAKIFNPGMEACGLKFD